MGFEIELHQLEESLGIECGNGEADGAFEDFAGFKFEAEAQFVVARARVERLVALMKSTAPAPGYDEVMVAGDPEWRTEAERRRNGIPVAEGNWETLCKAAARVKVAAPAV